MIVITATEYINTKTVQFTMGFGVMAQRQMYVAAFALFRSQHQRIFTKVDIKDIKSDTESLRTKLTESEQKNKTIQSERDSFEKQLFESFGTHKQLTDRLMAIEQEKTALDQTVVEKEIKIKQLQTEIDVAGMSIAKKYQKEKMQREAYEVLIFL